MSEIEKSDIREMRVDNVKCYRYVVAYKSKINNLKIVNCGRSNVCLRSCSVEHLELDRGTEYQFELGDIKIAVISKDSDIIAEKAKIKVSIVERLDSLCVEESTKREIYKCVIVKHGGIKENIALLDEYKREGYITKDVKSMKEARSIVERMEQMNSNRGAVIIVKGR